MTDEVVVALNGIAKWLQRRVEQTDEATARGADHLAAIQGRSSVAAPEFMKRMQESSERSLRGMEQVETMRAEERAFQERVVHALERQNTLIEQVLAHLKA